MTAEALENAMVVGPRQEASLFTNRDKFDLIAMYDSSTSSFGPDAAPISILLRLIWVQAFKKMLKRTPMLLVGGIEAWKKEFGEIEIVRSPGYASDVEIRKPFPKDYSVGVGNAHSRNPYVNGLGSPALNGTSSLPTVRDLTTKSEAPPEQPWHSR
jgi:ubiquitin carboxyl-terminal hydrolase 8